ncbi:MAG: DivIVA domain-containing protein [Bifidobacteriaceae bacterium]|nr:DivIVA domain-containing protein [Bifidobacteriaceae bacterium]
MTQEDAKNRASIGLARAGKHKWGYDVEQVDAFLERAHSMYDSDTLSLTQEDIQEVSFDIKKHGYVISQVDAALSRLERAVIDKQTEWEISENGRVAWRAQTEDLAKQILNHVQRDSYALFKAGTGKATSYDFKQVDAYVDRIAEKIEYEFSDKSNPVPDNVLGLTSTKVSNVTFIQRKGKRGYDERQVDYFLSACVRLLSRLESYERISEYLNNDEDEVLPSKETETVTSLFNIAPAVPAEQVQVANTATPDAEDDGSSFDALHKAEESIFANTGNNTPVFNFPETQAEENVTPLQALGQYDTPEAQLTVQVQPTEQPQPAAVEQDNMPIQNSSLASLARNTSHEEDKGENVSEETTSFDPLAEEGSNTNTGVQSEYLDSIIAKPEENSLSLDIPNLSFPIMPNNSGKGESEDNE